MSLAKIDQQPSNNNINSSSSSSSTRRSSLLVNLSTVKKRSSVTTYLASSCSTLASRGKRTIEATCHSPTSAPIISCVSDGGDHQRVDTGDGDDRNSAKVLHSHVLVCPQSAPPTLSGGPSYCITNSTNSRRNSNSNDNSSSDLVRVEDQQNSEPIMNAATNDYHDHYGSKQQITNQQQKSFFQVDEIVGNCKQEETTTTSRRTSNDLGASRKNSKDNYSPEPIVEVKHTSSSSSSASSSSAEHSSDNNNNNDDDEQDSSSRKLIRRRTVRRYHRALIDEPHSTSGHPDAIELTISINNDKSDTQADSRQFTDRGQFRTRQIGSYCNQQINKQQQQQQQHQQQQQQTKTSSSSSSSSSLTSSTSKLAKCSITTNRKSTTSHREHLISKSSLLSSSTASSSTSTSASKAPPAISKTNLHDNTSNKSISTSTTSMQPEMTTPTTTAEPKSPSQRLLELRLNNQFKVDLFDHDDSNKNDAFKTNINDNKDLQLGGGSRNSIEVNSQKQEESSVHHSRQSFSSTLTSSMRAGSLRKAAISSSSSLAASEEAAEAALVSRRHSRNGGLISTSNLSTSSSSHRHFKSSAHSLSMLSAGDATEAPPSLTVARSREPATVFLDSESLFASPDVRSLVKEIGTDFAELENALSSRSDPSSFRNQRCASGSSSLSSRLFGQVNNRRPMSPLNGDANFAQYPAITGNDENLKTHPVRRDQSGNSSSQWSGANSDLELPAVKCNRFKSNLSSASESSNDRWSPRQNSERIKELMSQAQSHVDRYGISPGATPTPTNQSVSRDLGGSKSPTFKTSTRTSPHMVGMGNTRSELASSSSSPADVAGDQRRRQEVEKGKSVEGAAKLHQNHCKAVMTESIERIDQRMSDLCKKFSECRETGEAIDLLKIMIQMIEKAWSVPVCGDDLGFKLCNSLREAGGLDIILGFIQDSDISHKSAISLAGTQQANGASYLPPVLFNGSCGEPTATNVLEQVAGKARVDQDNKTQQQDSSLQAKNKSSSIPLRLNLSKLNPTSEVSAQSLDLSPADAISSSSTIESVSRIPENNNDKSPTTTITTTQAAKDSDSDMITSDLGLDSTSIDSLSYVTPPMLGGANSDPREGDCETFQSKSDASDVSDASDGATSVKPQTIEAATISGDSMTMHETEAEAEAEKGDEEEAKTSLMKDELVYLSARLLSQCLTSENRNYIVENGLDQVIRLACNLITMKSTQCRRLLSSCSLVSAQQQINGTTTTRSRKTSKNLAATDAATICTNNPQPEVATNLADISEHQQLQALQNSRNEHTDTQMMKSPTKQQQQVSSDYSDMHAIIGTEILQHLFKHSEDTCARLISLGGLEAILFGCRSSNIETLRHCASALANLALYGGPEGQQRMIEQKAHVWLFPLAFNEDDNIQYYACLAIVVLVANQEIEADVLKSSTLDLVEPFVTSHEPQKFAESSTTHIHGQSASWLRRLIPLLESKREEARNLACFHFAMEAYIKKEQGQTQVFKETGAVEPLRKVGSSPIAIASKFACQALRLIGEKEPHKLSQQVPLWTSEDVSEWVSQIGFERYRAAFVESRVDGDLLLQLDEDMLRTDIGIENGIVRRRFLRELASLKRIADYSSVDKSGLSSLLGSTGTHDFVQYIYPMVQLGVTRDNIHLLDSEQLLRECKVANTIHRMKLAHAIKELQEKMAVAAASSECCSDDGTEKKTLDVFMSYRRSTGSQLASLLKVFLELRNFSVFIDVDRLEAGKFDNNLLDSIKAAKNFILILSPNALDRCIGDHECKDWVHKEIVAALASNCNIIPIIDNFHWPDPEQLPEDMRSITYFNGVRWIHDYQDACVDKVERFIRGELSNGATIGAGGPQSIQSTQSSSLQRLVCGGGGGSTYSSTPSIVATPSILPGCGGGGGGFPSGSVSAYSSRAPFDTDYHPLSFALSQNQYLHSTQSPSPGGGGGGARRC